MSKSRKRGTTVPLPAARASSMWPAVAIACAALAAYWNSLTAPFFFDDISGIVYNTSIRSLWHVNVLWPGGHTTVTGRPLVNLSLALDYALGGLDVRVYHATNIALHIACGLLMLAVVRRTLESPALRAAWGGKAVGLAFASALVWTLHPLNTEVVDYAIQRTESMMALCGLATLYASVRALRSSRPAYWHVAAMVACMMGMACKETMVVVPLLVVLYDRIYVFESFQQAVRARARLYAGLAASWLLLAALVSSGARSNTAGFANEYAVSPWTYLLNQAVIVTTYMGRVVWPRHLVVNYGFPHLLTLSDVVPYVTLLVLLLLLTLLALVKKPRVGFLGAWVFLTLAPTSSLLPIATEVGAERRMYLPLMAVVVLAVMAGEALRKSARQAAPVVLVIVATAFGVRTILRNRDYASSVSLFRTAVEGWPEGSTQYLLAKSLLLSGSRAEGLEHLRTAAATAPRAHYDLGVELAADGKLDDAAAHLTTLLALAQPSTVPHPVWDPPTADDVTATHHLLGDVFFAQQQYEKAIAHYRDYLAQQGRDADALNHLGIALAVTGKTDDAVATFRLAVNANDANGWAMRNLANALLDRDQIAEATTYARRAVSTTPEDAAAHDVLGRALGRQGRLDEAVSEFERALQISPTFADAREHLAQAQRARR